MSDLSTLMLHGALTPESFEAWVRSHYGDPHGEALVAWVARHHRVPHPLDALRVKEIDSFLMQLKLEDGEFIRKMFELRNVFAQNAKLATPEIMSLDRTSCMYAPAKSSLLAETLTQLLCAESS